VSDERKALNPVRRGSHPEKPGIQVVMETAPFLKKLKELQELHDKVIRLVIKQILYGSDKN